MPTLDLPQPDNVLAQDHRRLNPPLSLNSRNYRNPHQTQIQILSQHGVGKEHLQHPVRELGPLAGGRLPPLVHQGQQNQLHRQTYAVPSSSGPIILAHC